MESLVDVYPQDFGQVGIVGLLLTLLPELRVFQLVQSLYGSFVGRYGLLFGSSLATLGLATPAPVGIDTGGYDNESDEQIDDPCRHIVPEDEGRSIDPLDVKLGMRRIDRHRNHLEAQRLGLESIVVDNIFERRQIVEARVKRGDKYLVVDLYTVVFQIDRIGFRNPQHLYAGYQRVLYDRQPHKLAFVLRHLEAHRRLVAHHDGGRVHLGPHHYLILGRHRFGTHRHEQTSAKHSQ